MELLYRFCRATSVFLYNIFHWLKTIYCSCCGSCCICPTSDYAFQSCKTAGKGTIMYRILHKGLPMTYEKSLNHMSCEKEFQEYLTWLLTECEFSAFQWEVVPVTKESTKDTEFVFAVTKSQQLDRMQPDSETFSQHFHASEHLSRFVRNFANLGKDSMLVSPRPWTWLWVVERDYTHLAKFLRKAPVSQSSAFWSEVARVAEKELMKYDRPLWLSTAGTGVGWLHARIDKQPKYYVYSPFREFPASTVFETGGGYQAPPFQSGYF